MDLPFILAGPILRRVEPTRVAVWLALSEPAHLKLEIREGLSRPGENRLIARGPGVSGTPTLRVGKRLHIGVVTLDLPAEDAMTPERNYAYDVLLSGEFGNQNLASLDLLKDGKVAGKTTLALGYQEGFLPSFALPPVDIADLKLLHGSCRRTNKNRPDGLAWADEFIQATRADARQRPHQMFLTGDQIYADDVSALLLCMLNDLSLALMGSETDASEESVPFERIPVEEDSWPVDLTHFPSSYRLGLTQNAARFTSRDGHSHLLGFGEFAAMYLLVWANSCWPQEMDTSAQTQAALKTILQQRVENFGWLGLIPAKLRSHVIRPPEIERLLKYYKIGRISRAALENAIGTSTTLPPVLTDAVEIKAVEDSLNAAVKRDFDTIVEHYRTLPKVRRALANVPTYMMFDDHEVTDDWNLNPIWRDRVFTSPLGRTILRNGLVAYALFQAWGNDPAAFEKGKRDELLRKIRAMFPEGSKNLPDKAVATEVDILLGLDGKDPPVKWHYAVPGSRHKVIALDNRTRRSFVSRIGPPGNVSAKAMKEQIPKGPLDAGLELLIVVAPLPVLGPPVFDELLAPLIYRTFDMFAYGDLEKASGSKNMPGTNPDAIEGWANDPKTFETLLKRFAPYRQVVFLSGDVHYGSSQAMSYWSKSDTEPSRFAQFTASGLRNTMPSYILLADRSFTFLQSVIRADIGTERLGWDKSKPEPLTIPDAARLVPALRQRLGRTPVLLPTHGWPDGTRIKASRPPDWQWRVEALVDDRPDPERAELAQPEPLKAGDPEADVAPDLDGYRAVRHRHVRQLDTLNNSRQILFANNIGLVRFERRGDVLHAIHEIHTALADNPVLEKATPLTFKPITQHVVPLSTPTEPKPEEKLSDGSPT